MAKVIEEAGYQAAPTYQNTDAQALSALAIVDTLAAFAGYDSADRAAVEMAAIAQRLLRSGRKEQASVASAQAIILQLESLSSTLATEFGSYTPAVADDWEDPDPITPGGALDRIAGGHAGVCLVSDTEPATPADGQFWLDTAVTGSGGSGVLTVHTITADATLTASQTVILCDASTGAITVTLPAASANGGRRYFIKKIDSSAAAVTIDGNASETIDGDLTVVVRLRYRTVLIVCDGSNWHIL